MSPEKGSSILPRSITGSELAESLAKALPGLKIHPSARWKDYSSAGAGTATFFLVELFERSQLNPLISFAAAAGLHLYPLGGGTNIIGSDEPMEHTLFLKLGRGKDFSALKLLEDGSLFCGAANGTRQLLDFALRHGFGGASGLYGIPGTVGGALCMNAGANGQTITDFLLDLELFSLRDGTARICKVSDLKLSYRSSGLDPDHLIIGARFRLQRVVPSRERELFNQELERRKYLPKGRSAGSVFKNPAPGLSAGQLLDRCGMKNTGSGLFRVSGEHANWIVNAFSASGSAAKEEAREEDFVKTAAAMVNSVNRQTGIVLNPEVRFLNMKSMKAVRDAARRLKILVLKGGVSSEREISLESAANVAANLRAAGHEVREYDIRELKITDEMKEADVVYPVLHGGFGEDGRLQEMLEQARIPFVGASSQACRAVMDKLISKQIMDRAGIPNARYAVLKSAGGKAPEGMNFPLIVKPVSEGSTFGLTLVESEDQWEKALELALKYGGEALVEDYICGVEGTVGILLGQALPPVEIRYPGKLYDYDAKYTHALGETRYLCPPEGISQEAQEEAKSLALKFAEAVGAAELLRVDFIVTENGSGKVYLLEGNSMPGCTASSLLPKEAAAAGISGPEMCSRLAFSAIKKGE